MDKNLTVWILVERGLIGTEKQCIAVAEALGAVPVVKRITLRQPWKALSPYLNIGIAHGYEGDDLSAPWPDVLIAAGRKSIGLALWIKHASKGKTLTVCLLDPRVKRGGFDLIASPAHDPANGSNVLRTVGAPNSLTPDRIKAAAEKWGPVFAHLPQPRVAVLIGGNSRVHRMSSSVTGDLGAMLKNLAKSGAGLMVTASRRTGPENQSILTHWLEGTGAYVWDGTGDNPYEGFLALADYIIVTSDSVSMMSEAASTGKPVYRVDLDGGSKRFAAFHALLDQKGITRPFDGTLSAWTYAPINDSAAVAAAIGEKLGISRQPSI